MGHSTNCSNEYFTFSGSVTGDEPKSMVCKITGNTKRDIAFIWRFITHTQCKSQFDEYISRNESLFYNEIVPLIKDDGYLTPRMYFVGKLCCYAYIYKEFPQNMLSYYRLR